jgi:hypothetical protein
LEPYLKGKKKVITHNNPSSLSPFPEMENKFYKKKEKMAFYNSVDPQWKI